MGAGDVEQLGRDLAANSDSPAGEGGADEEAAA
jgi:hypothetical protein